MNCDGVSILLSAYLDGELTPGELLRVEEHLRRCHACADEVDSLRQTVALVASLEEVEVPASFQVQLHQRLVALGPPVPAVRRAGAVPSWQRGVRRWAVPAAAAAAALAIGVSTYNSQMMNLAGGLRSASEYNLPTAAPTPGPSNPGVDNSSGPAPSVAPTVIDTPKPPAPENAIVTVTPGPTNPGDGAHTVTPSDPIPALKVEPKMAYTYNVAVKGAIPDETWALIRSENSLAVLGENTLTAKWPPNSREAVLERFRTIYFPGATIVDASQDRGPKIAAVEQDLQQALRQLEKNQMIAGSVQESDQKQVDSLKEELDLLVGQTRYVTFVVTFTP